MLPGHEFQLPNGRENKEKRDEKSGEGLPQVHTLVGRVWGQERVVAEDAQVGEVTKRCLSNVGEGTLMENFVYGVRRTFPY